MTTRTEAQSNLEAMKLRQVEMDRILVSAREDVEAWLTTMAMAIYRESNYLQARGDIADRELHAPWKLLQESIGRLRDAQEAVKRVTGQIEEAIQELADDSLWDSAVTSVSAE